MIKTKACTKCGEEKTFSEFKVKKAECVKCKAEYNREYYKKNSKKLRESARKYRNENAEKVRACNLKYYKENSKKACESRRKHYKINIVRIRLEKNENYKKNSKVLLERDKEGAKNLADWYVKKIMCQNSKLMHKDIPPELVELKRLQIAINREVKKRKVS